MQYVPFNLKPYLNVLFANDFECNWIIVCLIENTYLDFLIKQFDYTSI